MGFNHIWMRWRGFSAWGIQTGPFAACWANFVLKFFQPFTFIVGSANSFIPQESEKIEIAQLYIKPMGFTAWGIQTGPFAACWAYLVLKFFQPLTFILGSDNSFIPQESENTQPSIIILLREVRKEGRYETDFFPKFIWIVSESLISSLSSLQS